MSMPPVADATGAVPGSADHSAGGDPGPGPGPVTLRLGAVLWPAFLMAGVMETLIFAVVDPGDLRWFGSQPVEWPREAVYTVTFLLCWAVTGLASGLTALLLEPAAAINRRSLSKHFP